MDKQSGTLTTTQIFMRNLEDLLAVTEFNRDKFLELKIIPVERFNALERGVQTYDITLDEARLTFYRLKTILHLFHVTFEDFYGRILTKDFLRAVARYDLQR